MFVSWKPVAQQPMAWQSIIVRSVMRLISMPLARQLSSMTECRRQL
jgi:hypothetical protein